MNDDKRLIEDYLPLEAISAEASREETRKGDSHEWRFLKDSERFVFSHTGQRG